MFAAIEKWQATALVLATIAALVILAIVASAPADLVVGALAGIPGLVLGAGAVAHGVRQGARSTAAAELRTDARVERELDRADAVEHRRT